MEMNLLQPAIERNSYFKENTRHREEILEQELKECQESFANYRLEIESTCRQAEETNQKLQSVNRKLEEDVAQLRKKLNSQNSIVDSLHLEIQTLKASQQELTKRNRQLEQDNDDLERAVRETKVSEAEIERQLNMTLERLALVETEMDDKEDLLRTIQELKEQNRDEQLGKDCCRVKNKHLLDYVSELEQKIKKIEKKFNETNEVVNNKMETNCCVVVNNNLEIKENFRPVIAELKERSEQLVQRHIACQQPLFNLPMNIDLQENVRNSANSQETSKTAKIVSREMKKKRRSLNEAQENNYPSKKVREIKRDFERHLLRQQVGFWERLQPNWMRRKSK